MQPSPRIRLRIRQLRILSHNDVPDQGTLDELRKRLQLNSTFELPDGGYLDFWFDSQTGQVSLSRSTE